MASMGALTRSTRRALRNGRAGPKTGVAMEPLIETTRIEGYEAVRLRSSSAQLDATFVPEVGMVGASLRDRGAELLYANGGVHRYARGGSTMGIPLLHPWANRLAGDRYSVNGTAVRLDPASRLVQRDDHGLPIHGLLNGSPRWRRTPAPDGWALSAELDFGAHRDLLAAFPFPHRLRLDVALRRRTLTVRTTLTAAGDHRVPVAFGFHPYLRLPDVPRDRWHVELPAMRHLELDERSIPTGASSPVPAQTGRLGTRTFDDGYVDVAHGAEFVVAGGLRRITVRLEEGYPAAQVFAPSASDVICFEPMTAPANALASGERLALVAPGGRYTATFSITVDRR
jgi:aldose 1-epimerase